jgi:hypothetical protein
MLVKIIQHQSKGTNMTKGKQCTFPSLTFHRNLGVEIQIKQQDYYYITLWCWQNRHCPHYHIFIHVIFFRIVLNKDL